MADSCITVGIDEVGRGCVFGPLYVVALYAHEDYHIKHVADSKKLTPKKRTLLAESLQQHSLWACARSSNNSIDCLGMKAAVLATGNVVLKHVVRQIMAKSIPGNIIAVFDGEDREDGSKIVIDGQYISVVCKPKADETEYECSAASIVAKVMRDNWIDETVDQHQDELEPYGLKKNRGYPTPAMGNAIRTHGLTQWHRRTFCETFVPGCLETANAT